MDEVEKKDADRDKGDVMYYVIGEIWDNYGQSTRISMYSEADKENKITRKVIERWRKEMQDSLNTDETMESRFKDCAIIITFFHRLGN